MVQAALPSPNHQPGISRAAATRIRFRESHRLNRGDDRQLNRALHTIVMWRMHHHTESHDYLVRRRAEGKSDREIRRCLKRHLARRLFKLLQRVDSL